VLRDLEDGGEVFQPTTVTIVLRIFHYT